MISLEIASHTFWLHSPLLQFIGIIGTLSFLFLTIDNQVLAISYTNYTSDKFQIQFQYPATWQLTERQNRFEEGVDIKVQGSAPYGLIMVQYVNLTELVGMDFRELFYNLYKEDIGAYGREIRIIEQPSFFNIDGQNAATYLYTTKDKYEDYAIAVPIQKWIISAGDHVYFLAFSASIGTFDNPEIKQMRDTFIKSVEFLGTTNNSTFNSVPNRFQ
jgi:hypothetical protein